MRHPLWILNSVLLILFIVVLFFIFFSRTYVPAFEEIEPEDHAAVVKKETFDINIKKIYEHDLFNTYTKIPPEIPQASVMPTPPEPPQPQQLKIPEVGTPQFLEPLKVSLKGITAVSSDYTKNRAIIADMRTNKETLYKVGDFIEDAQLIKIFNKKIIFLRMNGQQEILYLRDVDAQNDPTYLAATDWGTIAQKVSDNNYVMSIKEFCRHVKDLAQFINLFDLTTVYQKGYSVGCRVGLSNEPLLVNQFGIETNDLILSVNDIPATNTQNRLKIYNTVLSLRENDVVVVSLLRRKKPVTIHITLSELKPIKAMRPIEQMPLADRASAEQLEILHKRHSFAPTLEEIKARERKNMLNKNSGHRSETTAPITLSN
jgi:type II secretory pathway component PulC